MSVPLTVWPKVLGSASINMADCLPAAGTPGGRRPDPIALVWHAPMPELCQQSLEPRNVADGVPARVEPQGLNGKPGGSRQESLDLVERRLSVASLCENLRPRLCHLRTFECVIAVEVRLLQPTRLA